jgi:putative addiction module component (TIGR02574 family)
MSSQIPQFENLNFAEKLQMLEILWNEIAESPESLPVHEWQKEELDQRMKNYAANPDSGISWDEAKKRIRGRDD